MKLYTVLNIFCLSNLEYLEEIPTAASLLSMDCKVLIQSNDPLDHQL